MNAGRLEADDFIEKANAAVLPDRILQWPKERGRERHADCAECTRSRPKDAPAAGERAGEREAEKKETVARILGHDGCACCDEGGARAGDPRGGRSSTCS